MRNKHSLLLYIFKLNYLIMGLIIPLAIIALFIASLWVIFTKAGKPGWASIVPIYNTIVLLEIAGKPWWWIFGFMVPVVNLVVIIMVYHIISTSFGKSSGYTVGMILLPFVFLPMLAFSDAEYTSPAES